MSNEGTAEPPKYRPRGYSPWIPNTEYDPEDLEGVQGGSVQEDVRGVVSGRVGVET